MHVDTRTRCRAGVAAMLLLMTSIGASIAGARTTVWENRGQAEFGGSARDVDGRGDVRAATLPVS